MTETISIAVTKGTAAWSHAWQMRNAGVNASKRNIVPMVFGDPYSANTSLTITKTMKQQIGQIAADIILRMVGGRDAPRLSGLPLEFVVRASTTPPQTRG